MINSNELVKIALEINGIDNNKVVKAAGVIARLRSWYNSLFDPVYREKVQRMTSDSSIIKSYLKELDRYIDKFEKSISNGDVDTYNYSLNQIQEVSSSLAKALESYNISLEGAKAPNQKTNETNLSKIDKVYFTQKMKSEPRIHALLANALIEAGLSQEEAQNAVQDPLLYSAIEKAVSQGQVISSEIAKPSKQRPDRAGELWVNIYTQPFKITNYPASLQLEAIVTDMSGRKDSPKPEMAIKWIRNIKARKTANKNIYIKKNAASSISAIKGLEKKSPEFIKELINVGNRLGVNPAYLAAVMASESGFDPSIKNPIKMKGGHPTGLIQFVPLTAKQLGTTVQDLGEMSDIDQLHYVEKFYQPWAGKLKTPGDVYMATFLPVFVGKPSDTILGQAGNMNKMPGGLTYDIVYKQNKGFDTDKDGIIRISDVAGKVEKLFNNASKIPPLTINDDNTTSVPKQESLIKDNYDDEIKDLSSYLGVNLAMNIDNIVKKAVSEKMLPISKVKLKLNDENYSSLVTYASILSNAIDRTLDADTNIYSNGKDVELVIEAAGNLLTLAGAIDAVNNVINYAFNNKYGNSINKKIILNKDSNLNILLDSSIERQKRIFNLTKQLKG